MDTITVQEPEEYTTTSKEMFTLEVLASSQTSILSGAYYTEQKRMRVAISRTRWPAVFSQ